MRLRRSQDPERYLEHALQLLRHHALERDRIDWEKLLPRAYAVTSEARTVADTYPAIGMVVDELRRHDAHSFFRPAGQRPPAGGGVGLAVLFPECVVAMIAPGGPADRAGVRSGDRLIAVDDGSPRQHPRSRRLVRLLNDGGSQVRLTLERANELFDVTLQRGESSDRHRPTGRRLSVADGRLPIGYLSLPGSDGRGYATDLRALRRRIESVGAWVVDLRQHTGGNMWPALAGLRSILGPGVAGMFVDADGRVSREWSGKSSRRRLVPVAVLQGPLTGSAGEALVISFRGRPGARTFGTSTYGLPTANQTFALADGALLMLTTAREADRTGRVYDGLIQPDEHVDIDWATLGTPNDPVLTAAIHWVVGASLTE